MGHDMSDPRMAAAMEADMRRRFWVALILSLPVIAYSSLGTLLLGGRELRAYPAAATDPAHVYPVDVGRIREDLSHPRGLDL